MSGVGRVGEGMPSVDRAPWTLEEEVKTVKEMVEAVMVSLSLSLSTGPSSVPHLPRPVSPPPRSWTAAWGAAPTDEVLRPSRRA